MRRLLVDPRTVMAGVLVGFLIGLYARPVGQALLPVGSIYVSFLSMCLAPILISSIVDGVAGLLRDTSTRPLFNRMAIYYFAGLILPCVVGMGSAWLLQPGTNLGEAAERSIGALVLDSPAKPMGASGVVAFLSSIIPTNIFEALSTNQVMSIVFASVAVGLALGVVQTPATTRALELVGAVHATFMQLFRWAVVLLAPGLACLVGGVVAGVEPSTLVALLGFIWVFYLGGFALFLLYLILFWLSVRGSPFVVAKRLSNVNVLAFMTNNPVLALPAALETMNRSFGVDRRVSELVLPFGIFANQHGGVFLLSFLTMFLAQLYVVDLQLQDLLVVALGSMIAGATAVGGGAILVPTVAPVLAAVGIPTPVALVVLATTDNIIGPVRTVLTLQANLTFTELTARRGYEAPEVLPEQDEAWELELEETPE